MFFKKFEIDFNNQIKLLNFEDHDNLSGIENSVRDFQIHKSDRKIKNLEVIKVNNMFDIKKTISKSPMRDNLEDKILFNSYKSIRKQLSSN